MCEQTISLIGRTSRSYLSRGRKQSTILDFMDTTFYALSNLSQISKLRHTSRSVLCYHISTWHGNAMLQEGENKHSSRCQWETKYTWRYSTFADYIKVECFEYSGPSYCHKMGKCERKHWPLHFAVANLSLNSNNSWLCREEENNDGNKLVYREQQQQHVQLRCKGRETKYKSLSGHGSWQWRKEIPWLLQEL